MITREKLNSRKLAVCMVTFATCTALVAAGMIEGADYRTIVLGIVGSYMASQGWVDAKSAK